MTDAAIAADSGAAPVDAGVPIADVADFTNPLGSQVPESNTPAEPKQPASLDDVLDRATAKVEAKAAEAKAPPAKVDAPKVDAKAEPAKAPEAAPEKPAAERAPDGKFVAKAAENAPQGEQQPAKQSFTASEPPARFSPDAKAEWAAVPEPVRAETERAIRELTEGHQKYKAAAERDSQLHEFHEMAKQSGKELHGVVREYVQMEQLLSQDLPKGIETILNRMGVTPRQYAEHVLGQSPDQVAGQQEQTIAELRRELAEVKQSVGQVTQTFQKQQEQSTLQQVTEFAQNNPRFEELADDIAFFMKSGRAQNLPEAYQLAERLNPAPKAPDLTPPAASSAPVIDLQAQTQKGSKSINGAPGTGSSPSRKRSTSIDESLDRALGRTG